MAWGMKRSAMAARWSPGVREAWDMNVLPNTPAPMRPTRIVLPAAASSAGFVEREVIGSRLSLGSRTASYVNGMCK